MKTPELVTPPPPIPKPSRSSRGCPGENECSSWQRQWYGDAMAHQESCPLVPRWKLRPRPRVAQWLPRHLFSSERLGTLAERQLGSGVPRAAGWQGSGCLGRLLPGFLAGPRAQGGSEDALRPAPFEPLAQPLAAVNDYPAVCQYRSQVRFEGQEALDCARAGWGGSRKHQAEFLSGFPRGIKPQPSRVCHLPGPFPLSSTCCPHDLRESEDPRSTSLKLLPSSLSAQIPY